MIQHMLYIILVCVWETLPATYIPALYTDLRFYFS